MTVISDLPEIDFSAPHYRKAPLSTLAGYAKQFKLARSGRGVEILDYDLCRDAIVNRRFGTAHPGLMALLGMPEGPALHYKRHSISFHNRGEKRRRLRVPLTTLMGPKRSEQFRTGIRQVVHETLASLPRDRPIDIIAALCDLIPSRVYCYWVDAPMADAEFIARSSHVVQQVHSRNPETTQAVTESFEALLGYVDRRIAAVRQTPNDSLLSQLIRATKTGQLTEDDLRNWVVKLAEANTDNSSHQIAIAVIELASRPEIWAMLGRNPSLVPQALREVMRYHPRSLSTSREALEDVDLEGVSIPKGTVVFANIAAAHWNAHYFPAPNQFDINRPDKSAHLNFGGGVFSCIGRFAVTIEIEEVIAHMAAHFPALKITKSVFAHSAMFTSVTALEAVLDG